MIIDLNNDNIKLLKSFQQLPKDIEIATISISFIVNISFNMAIITKLLKLNKNKITTIKYSKNNILYVKSLYPDKYKKKKNKKKKKSFTNQLSIIIDKNEFNNLKNDIHFKIFINGSVQLSGCDNYNNFEYCINILFEELFKDIYKFSNKHNKFILKKYITPSNITVSIISFKINLANVGFRVPFDIDRNKLFQLFPLKNATYDPSIYSGVIINYMYIYQNYSKHITISVFESGYIMINGGTFKNAIITAYKYINEILYNNYSLIVKKSLSDFINLYPYP